MQQDRESPLYGIGRNVQLVGQSVVSRRDLEVLFQPFKCDLRGRSVPLATTSSLPRPVVLVVEDEPFVLMVALDLITNEGYEAIGVANADAAIRILESRNAPSQLQYERNRATASYL